MNFVDGKIALQPLAEGTHHGEIEFSPDLSIEERKEIHLLAGSLGLDSMSVGEGSERYIVAKKRAISGNSSVNIPNRWTIERAQQWYSGLPWLVGCNFIPSTAGNQIEMWSAASYDRATIARELNLAKGLGFNTVRVYLHDLVWHHEKDTFLITLNDFLTMTSDLGLYVIFVLFDDCYLPDPQYGVQPLPVRGVFNSIWAESPGRHIVESMNDGTCGSSDKARLQEYVQGILKEFRDDARILMWDLYNLPALNNLGDKSNAFLVQCWQWAQVRFH